MCVGGCYSYKCYFECNFVVKGKVNSFSNCFVEILNRYMYNAFTIVFASSFKGCQ